MAKHTLEELQQWQALPLGIKIRMTEERIRDWVREYGEDGVYVSFSGGKDSTVLLDIVRKLYLSVKAVFVDTGLEYPEIREFVRGFDNVDWLKPKMNFKQVIEKHGYPFISKEISESVYEARRSIELGKTDTLRIRQLTGKTNGRFDKSRYSFFLESDFRISHLCCSEMKKKPVKRYEKETGRKPITGQMASESVQRTSQWLSNGCNGFQLKRPVSNPMAFWTEQDVLLYIKENNIPIASVYGDVIIDYDGEGQLDGQMDMFDLGIFENDRRLLKTTGCNRTGCMFCGFGCHLESSPNRFERMKETHPKQYDYIMRPKEQGGLNYKEVIDWINEHGNMNIKY